MNTSIVTSMYNAKPATIEVLDNLFFPSLINQGSSDKQLVLVNDGSPLDKETYELVKNYEHSIRMAFGDFVCRGQEN